ncbi:FAD-dependent oxidoreductase [Mycolicibacterium agri]|uniref:FAD-dependent oxidoreductase n=1 Tax=Mycolicibacterium agri TaxID=36811 RepID=A0A2A7MR02_MYCAG|nr:FAD-dependent oxidoreductase [Mycolicibacterium agri]PEG34155.1 FAD-dependent oxidoreductase [Mycolicibacterium agri]GFG53714.1 FAD-dependent oxidoreductase [Mycolicibacterium agri]
MPTINGQVSHWFDQLPAYRPALPGDRDVDVCIVGAGYTGLWTAYYLKRADPSLRIAILEARFAGFGASGRNGGWLSGLVPGDRNRMAAQHGRDGVVAWQRALNDAVDEVIDVAAREGIDAGIVKGGTMQIARNAAQASRLAAEVEEEMRWKVDGITVLTKGEAAERIRFDGVVAAYHNPHCARIQPARLARRLADTVEKLGVDIYEQSPVTEISPGKASTSHGTVTAPIVLRATEGFTASLPGLRRRWLPMNSSMIATDPIPDDLWNTIGWSGRETVGDTAHGFFYAQRTVDNRIAIGGRSVPYRYASRTDKDGRVPERTITHLTKTLRAVLPQIRDVPIAHGWCGVLAVPRDWSAGIDLDKKSGLGWAGGYVGHGVTATNLAGRTLADLVLDATTPLTELPWVGHRSPTWEPEPLRWLGVRGMYLAYKLADWHEARGRDTTSPIAVIADKIAGRP